MSETLPSFGGLGWILWIWPLCLVSCGSILFCFAYFWTNGSKHRHRCPPGPKPIPVLGNAHQIPTVHPWKTYSKWAKEFKTEVLYLNVLSFPIVVLDSVRVARDLLDKRSSIYSDRPRFPFFEMMGWTWAVQFIGYGEKFRRHRRPLHMYLSAPNVPTYWPVQHKEVCHLLQDLLKGPEDFMKHISHAAAGMAITMLYGLPRGPSRNGIIHIAEQATESLVAAGNFGDHFVDVLPIMKYIPEWFPGAGFKRQAREWRKLSEAMIDVPFQDVKRRIAEGDLTPCLVSRLLEVQARGEEPDMDDYLIKSTAGVIYLGGADTTLSAIYTFFLAMTLYPEVQRRAQAEIDVVCQGKRLPNLEDRDALPYIEHIIKELFRWNPTTPLGVPHSVSQEDIYERYSIPSGSTVMINLWSIFHDPEIYPNPSSFNPDRYIRKDGELDTEVPDPRTLAFGFGRRLCPGRFVGESAVWTIISGVLATLDIKVACEATGAKLTPAVEYSTGLVSRPLPFPCSIVPRSDSSKDLILSLVE